MVECKCFNYQGLYESNYETNRFAVFCSPLTPSQILTFSNISISIPRKDKAIQLQASTDPEVSRRLILPGFLI
jgi:hypothetical protein